MPKIKWEQALKDPGSMTRYNVGNENQIIRKIRDREIENPAPFSHRTLLMLSREQFSNQEFPFNIDGNGVYQGIDRGLQDVPIKQIIGILLPNNLGFDGDYDYSTTYREALFERLHGKSFTAASCRFLLSKQSKAEEMPDDTSVASKYRARGGMILHQYDDYYFVVQGQQRGIIAIYLLFQNKRTHLLGVPVVEQKLVGSRKM